MALLFVWLLLAVVLPACQKTDAAPEAPADEFWEAFYLQHTKIGHARTTLRRVTRGGRALVEADSLNHLTISRFGQRAQQDVAVSSVETPDGQLLGFKTEISSGSSPVSVTGHVEGPQLVIETQTKGRRETGRIPWSSEIRGFRGIEQSLEARPLQPGQKRSLKMLMPLLNQVADVLLVARDHEDTSVMGAANRLLRVESVARLSDGQVLNSTLWTDARGRTIKTRIEALQQESFRTSRELAIAAEPSEGNFDLGTDLMVKLDRPLANAHQTRQVRYRVELAGADPAKVFASGPTQSVRSLDANSAEVTVRSVRPGEPGAATADANAPGNEYLSANSVLQIDDPRIQQMAREGKGNAASAAQVAVALERYVHDAMTKRNFSQAFSTAAEVAASREGDCTEHAVLLAALARANRIPSRVAIGLVYVEDSKSFGFHMWTEMYLRGQWVPLDAIMGQGGIAAAHLKLTDSSLDGASAYSSFLPVAQVVGQLKISVIAAQ